MSRLNIAAVVLAILFLLTLTDTRLSTANSPTSPAEAIKTAQTANIALGKPVTVITNGANDNRESPGLYPSDVTDGSLDYLPSSWAQEDGTVGYVNNDYNQLMVITITIDLQGTYDITQIRYNMGHVQRAETWNADLMSTLFATTSTNPGIPYQGAWTEHNGNATLSNVTVVLQKTRVSYPTDWLFIGEIEIYGVPAGTYRPAFDLPFSYPNRGNATEQDFVSAWLRCTTAFFDHKLPGRKGANGDGLLWFWTGDTMPGTNCELFQNCYDGHEGYDFDDWACYGTTVYPAAAGEVVASETGWRSDGYGNRVVIRHGTSGYKTLYGHLNEIKVSSGSVDTTTPIGVIGETGCPGCGTHLHFNVYHNGKLVDPSGWEGNFTDPNEQQNGAASYRQWLYSVRRRTPVNHQFGTTLVAPSGNSIAYIPANAYTEDFELTVTELAPLHVPGQLVSTGHAAMFSARSISGASIDEFSNDFTVELRFSAGDIAGIDVDSLSIYLWDSQQNAWISLSTNTSLPASSATASSSQGQGTATATMRRLGYIALLGEPKYRVHLPLILR